MTAQQAMSLLATIQEQGRDLRAISKNVLTLKIKIAERLNHVGGYEEKTRPGNGQKK